MNPIPFNKPPIIGTEINYINELILTGTQLSGDGLYSKSCHKILESILNCPKALLTPSCTHSLELAAILANIQSGDEVIMPSFTFVSTANAFVLRGAKIVFVDIRPDTMNIDENLIENAITKHTRAIVPVHYAGVGCNMNKVMTLAEKYDLFVIEDAAQAIHSKYQGKFLGTFGQLGCLSFHETKNISCGEGGALIINESKLVERAEIIREKGTDRSKFFRGQVNKYGWIDIGSSYLPSELCAAMLKAQLESVNLVINHRKALWNLYFSLLFPLQQKGYIELPQIPIDCEHNGHIFYVKLKDLQERTKFLEYLKSKGVSAVFHYVPLHSSPAGLKYGKLVGADIFTTKESERLVRLPIFFNMDPEQIEKITDYIFDYFN